MSINLDILFEIWAFGCFTKLKPPIRAKQHTTKKLTTFSTIQCSLIFSHDLRGERHLVTGMENFEEFACQNNQYLSNEL